MSSKRKAIVLAVVSDVHVGSTLGMVPEDGVRLDDGGVYSPSERNVWLWECWRDYWERVRDARKAAGPGSRLGILYNGDLYEGDHHGTTQIISGNPETIDYLSDKVYSVPRALRPDWQIVVRGTEAHSGASGAVEEAFARRIQATEDAENNTHSWWVFRGEFNGLLIEAQHHGKFGRLPWTKSNPLAQQANHIFFEHAERDRRPPSLVFRSHMHKWGDSWKANRKVRVIQTPAWQDKTAFAHKVAPNSPPDIGGLIVTIQPDASYHVQEELYEDREEATWVAT